jgi:hypothetical protein
MASQAPSLPPTTPNPPDLPYLPQMGPIATDYLRRFALWAKKSLDSKQPLIASQAQTGIMLVAFDAPPGVTPNVWRLQVNQQGSFVATQVPLGQGQP